ncbi:hypothetical protein EMIT0P2_100105 [Pseudomonas sp. IT-P2]
MLPPLAPLAKKLLAILRCAGILPVLEINPKKALFPLPPAGHQSKFIENSKCSRERSNPRNTGLPIPDYRFH